MPILIERTDGGVSIMRLAQDANVADAVAKYHALHHNVLSYREVPESAIPVDRRYRDAWKATGNAIEVDVAKVTQLRDAQAVRVIDGMDRLQFQHLFGLENAARDLRAKINALAPGTYPAGQAAQITVAQYRNALIGEWKASNP